MPTSTLLLGDFGIHVDSTSCPFASEFLSLLDCFNITQYVKGPTHVKGHTLDLVCSTDTTPSHLQCLDLGVSDQDAILFTVPVPVPKQHISRITYRNIKTVSTLPLTNILETHLASDPHDTSLDGLVAHYNAAVFWGLDSLAPLKTRTVSFTHSAPWLTIELLTLKTTGHRLERLYKRSGLTVHHEAYKKQVRSYKEALSKAKTNYYTTLSGDQQNNPRMLFFTMNRILSPLDVTQLSRASDLCFRILHFFQENVATIHHQLLVSATTLPYAPQTRTTNPPTVRLPQCSHSSFSPVDSTAVAFVSQAKSSTCSLDPMPTTLMKSSLFALCPLMVDIISSSLESGMVLSIFKTASVTPILKKPGLDPDDLHNYRLISNLPFLSKILERAVAAQLQQHMSDSL